MATKRKTKVTRKTVTSVKRIGLPEVKPTQSINLRLKIMREKLAKSECTLEEFINDDQRFPLYLDTLKLGCHPTTAAARAGLNPDRAALWLKQGLGASATEGQKLFLAETRECIAQASTLAENAVLRSRPDTYLKSHTHAVLSEQSSASTPLLSFDGPQLEGDSAVLPRSQVSLPQLAAMLVELARAGIAIPSTAGPQPLIVEGKVESETGRP
jgi:hypothetical protein